MQYINDIDNDLLGLIAHIGNLDDNNERIRLYEEYRGFLIDYSMYFVDEIFGVDKANFLNRFASLNYDANSLFYNNKLLCVNDDVLTMRDKRKNYISKFQPYISFDLNIISQLKYLKTNEQDFALKETIKLCKSTVCVFDCINFGIENFMKDPDNLGLDEYAIEDMRNFESMFPYVDCDTGKIVPIDKRMASLINMYKDPNYINVIKSLYEKYYLVELIYLMSMIYIHFKHYKLSSKNKFEKFLEFCDKDIMLFHPCAINLAKMFYENLELRFFKKIQKNNKNLIGDIKNMAWDLFHLRFMEESIQSAHKDKSILQIPIFISKDKGLNGIRNAYQIKCLFKNNTTGQCQFFYKMNSLTQEQIFKFFNVESVNRRMSASHDMEATIKGLEFLLSKI